MVINFYIMQMEGEDHTVQGTYFSVDRKDEEMAFLTFFLLNV